MSSESHKQYFIKKYFVLDLLKCIKPKAKGAELAFVLRSLLLFCWFFTLDDPLLQYEINVLQCQQYTSDTNENRYLLNTRAIHRLIYMDSKGVLSQINGFKLLSELE